MTQRAPYAFGGRGRYATRWLVRVLDGEHAGREFIVIGSEGGDAVRRVAPLVPGSRRFRVEHAGVYDRARNDIVSPGT